MYPLRDHAPGLDPRTHEAVPRVRFSETEYSMRTVQEQPVMSQAVPENVVGLAHAFGVLLRSLIFLFNEYGYRINRVLPTDGTEPMIGPLELMTYTVATLPTAADYEGSVIYVSDGGAGTKFRGSDGTSWVSLG